MRETFFFPITNHQYAHLKCLTTFFFFCSSLKKCNKIHAIHKKIVSNYKKLQYIYMSYIKDTKELVIFLVKFWRCVRNAWDFCPNAWDLGQKMFAWDQAWDMREICVRNCPNAWDLHQKNLCVRWVAHAWVSRSMRESHAQCVRLDIYATWHK